MRNFKKKNMSECFKESIIKAERRHQLEYFKKGTRLSAWGRGNKSTYPRSLPWKNKK